MEGYSTARLKHIYVGYIQLDLTKFVIFLKQLINENSIWKVEKHFFLFYYSQTYARKITKVIEKVSIVCFFFDKKNVE